ncbi:hypothetical protein, partial [Streptomyces sp. NPDC001880]
MTTTAPITAETNLITRYAADIAFVTEEWPAVTLTDFAHQLRTASDRLADAGINGAEDLDDAATYLADADTTDGTEKCTLLAHAAKLLADTS